MTNEQFEQLLKELRDQNATLRRLCIATEVANNLTKDSRGRYIINRTIDNNNNGKDN